MWHVDDLKVSHVDSPVVSNLLELLNYRYGEKCYLTIWRGKIHDYLGMKLDSTEKEKVKIDMRDYLGKILDDLPKKIKGSA